MYFGCKLFGQQFKDSMSISWYPYNWSPTSSSSSSSSPLVIASLFIEQNPKEILQYVKFT